MPSEKTHRITFQRLETVIDDEGVSISSWVDVRSAWASKESRSGSQKWAAGGYGATVTELFRINWIPGWEPTPVHRLVHRGKVYDIESVENVRGENEEYEIRAVAHMSATGR